ncbi:hypothetical protein FACS1894178_7870 [Bacteroidia bacterium]|nr:hypothetical protein FACS1894178_7870 [Bacteroidia bacterium]
MQYVDYPVSHYTGVPNISIPLYEIDCYGYKLPITLSYHASGIRVDQEASWVGLGWNLNVGGAVSRSVKMTDDFLRSSAISGNCVTTGYYEAPEIINYNTIYPICDFPCVDNDADGACDNWNDFEIAVSNFYPSMQASSFFVLSNSCSSDISGGGQTAFITLKVDTEPDLFYYSLPNGISGKFILDKSRGAVLFDKSNDVKIEVIKRNHHTGFINIPHANSVYFVITTNDGVQYVLDKEEIVESGGAPYAFNKNYTVGDLQKLDAYGVENGITHVASWQLSKIILPNKREIKFSYENEITTTPIQESVRKYIQFGYEENPSSNGEPLYNYETLYEPTLLCIPWGANYSRSKSKQYSYRLKRIDWDFGHIDFEGFDRYDLYGTNANAQCLQRMFIYDKNDVQVKGYYFTYEYFNNSYTGEYTHVMKRLKLQNVKEFGNVYQSNNSGYTFSYHEGNMPAKNSKNVDYWGYNNGSNYGADYYNAVSEWGYYLPGKIKTSSFDYLKIGTLKEIKYPTGDKTEFEYEENTYEKSGAPEPSLLPTPVKNIVVYKYCSDSDNSHFPAYDSYTFTLSKPRKVIISYISEQYGGSCSITGFSTLIAHIKKNGSNISSLYLPENYDGYYYQRYYHLDLAAGTYTFEALTPPNDVLIEWKLENAGDLLNTGWHYWATNGAGLRIKSIKNNNLVRNFSYYGGTLINSPAQFYYDFPACASNGCYDNAICVVQLSESKLPLTSFATGYTIGYDSVCEYVVSDVDSSKTTYYFYNAPENYMDDYAEIPVNLPRIPNFFNGKALEVKYSNNGSLMKKIEFSYQTTQAPIIKAFVFDSHLRKDYPYSYEIDWIKKTREETTTYFSGQAVVEQTDFEYNEHFLPKKITKKLEDNKQYVKEIYYPSDFTDAVNKAMTDSFMIGIPVEVAAWNNNQFIGRKRMEYSFFNNKLYLPQYQRFQNPADLQWENIITYNLYDSKGNILKATGIDGVSTFYTYDSIGQYPLSVTKAGQTTTFTHKPLVGMSSQTDPRGVTTYFEYDIFGRLQRTKLMDDILKEFDYHYK